jgi:hypothetical protein
VRIAERTLRSDFNELAVLFELNAEQVQQIGKPLYRRPLKVLQPDLKLQGGLRPKKDMLAGGFRRGRPKDACLPSQ